MCFCMFVSQNGMWSYYVWCVCITLIFSMINSKQAKINPVTENHTKQVNASFHIQLIHFPLFEARCWLVPTSSFYLCLYLSFVCCLLLLLLASVMCFFMAMMILSVTEALTESHDGIVAILLLHIINELNYPRIIFFLPHKRFIRE